MINKFYIYANDVKKSQLVKQKLTKDLTKAGYEITNNATNIIVLGGDGTFVHACNKFINKNVKILLINTGFVGFYGANLSFNVKEIVKYFSNESNFIKPDIVKCSVDNKTYYAINEIVIEGINTISADCFINDNFYQWFWGSGLCFCTKTGSTGFNKSLGNSIILTHNSIWEMSEISPLAHAKYLSLRNSLILDGKQWVTIKNLRASGALTLMNDGYEHNLDVKATIILSIIKAKAKIGFHKDLKSYLEKLQQVFIIGGKNNGKKMN